MALKKTGHTWKYGTNLKKWVTLEKKETLQRGGDMWKCGSLLEKLVTLRKWLIREIMTIKCISKQPER